MPACTETLFQLHFTELNRVANWTPSKVCLIFFHFLHFKSLCKDHFECCRHHKKSYFEYSRFQEEIKGGKFLWARNTAFPPWQPNFTITLFYGNCWILLGFDEISSILWLPFVLPLLNLSLLKNNGRSFTVHQCCVSLSISIAFTACIWFGVTQVCQTLSLTRSIVDFS